MKGIAKMISIWLSGKNELIFACPECLVQVDQHDNYCCHCGRKFVGLEIKSK